MRRWYRNLDFTTLVIWFFLCICGLVAIYSSTHGEAQEFLLNTVQNSFQRQIMWMGISAIALVIILLIPMHLLIRMTPLIYFTTIGLLIMALITGREVSGARSWVYIGSIGFQSSELAKAGALLMSAFMLASRIKSNRISSNSALITIGILGLPTLLIILQNDLGTALVFIGLIPILWL